MINIKCKFHLVLVLLVSVTAFACTAKEGSAVAAPDSSKINKASVQQHPLSRRPDSKKIEAFLGSLRVDLPFDLKDKEIIVEDRIFKGFQAGPSMLRLDNNITIYWGFAAHQGLLQSVAVFDVSGALQLVAAVNDVASLTLYGEPNIESQSEYDKEIAKESLHPGVSVFVRNEGALKKFLPVLKRWQQANILGFNVDCDKHEMKRTCDLAKQIHVPIHAYVVDADGGKIHEIKVPQVSVSAIPLESFQQ